MRLSTAIRLGSQRRPQTKGTGFSTNDGEMKSCAMGAALEETGLVLVEGTQIKDGGQGRVDYGLAQRNGQLSVAKRIDVIDTPLQDLLVTPPCDCFDEPCRAGDLIPHLNDTHEWTREQVAHVIELAEKELEQQGHEVPEF